MMNKTMKRTLVVLGILMVVILIYGFYNNIWSEPATVNSFDTVKAASSPVVAQTPAAVSTVQYLGSTPQYVPTQAPIVVETRNYDSFWKNLMLYRMFSDSGSSRSPDIHHNYYNNEVRATSTPTRSTSSWFSGSTSTYKADEPTTTTSSKPSWGGSYSSGGSWGSSNRSSSSGYKSSGSYTSSRSSGSKSYSSGGGYKSSGSFRSSGRR